MKQLIIITILACVATTARAQDWLAGSSGNFVSEALDVVVDGNGNSYVTGYFSGEIRFNDITAQAASGFSDVFLAKFDSQGNMLWLNRYGGNQSDRGHKLSVDSGNNLYITGYFSGTMTMGSFTLNAAGSGKEIFIAKLTPAGVVTWARSDGGTADDIPVGMANDAQGNVVVTGRFEGNTTIGGVPFTSQTNPNTGNPSFDIFIAKYTTAGVPVWTKKGNSRLDDTGIAVTCDASNNIYVTGQYPDTMVFITQTINNQVNNAGYVAKLNASGDLQWFNKLGAAQTYASAIQLNNANELYLTGNFLGTMQIQTTGGLTQLTNPYIKKIFLIKMGSASGNCIWAKAQGSDSDVSSRGLTIDNNQDVYICGDFRCNFDEYRDLSATGLWNTVGFRDAFVSKFNPSGTMLWNKQSGGRREDLCYALANGGNDKPIYAGSFENDFFVPTNNYTLTNPSSSPENIVFTGGVGGFLLYYIEGDLSKNVFAGKVNDITNPDYYYYTPPFGSPPNSHDSIPPDLYPQQDTIEFCNAMYLYFEQHTLPIYGPEFNFSWSGPNNDQNPFLYVAHTNEMVTITQSSIDGCYTFDDTIITIAHQSPPFPLMSDDHGYNDEQTVSYHNIPLCMPDTALVSFMNLCPTCTLEVNYYNIPFHSGIDTFEVFTPGDYNVVITNEYGCTSQSVFAVIPDSIVPYDSIAPVILMVDADNFDDTITICEFETVFYIVIDTISNPNGDYTIYSEPFINESFFSPDVQTNMNVGPHACTIAPDETGWYHIHYNADIGFSNACGTDTIKYHIIDSFYIHINPNPAANLTLTSDSPICPGDSAYLSISVVMEGGVWTGSDIVWESNDHDSILVSEPGYYAYEGETSDTVTGCTSDFTVGEFVANKIPPLIQMFPYDGLICPNSTITLSVIPPGTYNWIGPDGSQLGTNSSLVVSSPGLYTCIYTDPEGCEFMLEQVQITEYVTPFLAYSPVNIFCDEGEIELIPVYNGVASVTWLDPINATTETVIVTDPGTYYVEIFQCGTTTLDSVTILDAQFTATIQADDNLLCPGGTVTLTTNPGMISYEWNDGEFLDNTYTVTEPGDYSVTMINDLGCEETVSITIGMHNVPPLPTIQDQIVCQASTVVLTDNSGFQTNWYANLQDSIADGTGNSFSIHNIQQSVTIYVTHPHPDCPFNFEAVELTVIPLLATPTVNGDATLCEGEPLSLSTDSDPSYQIAWVMDGDTLSHTETLDLPYSAFPDDGTIILSIWNSCSQKFNTVPLDLIPEYTLQLNIEESDECDYVPVSLYGVAGFSGQIYWTNNGDSLAGNPLTVAAPLEDSIFYAYGIDDNGCVTLPTLANIVFIDCTPHIPNVITANGDGTNDYFIIRNAELMHGNYLIILNRWGNIVYETGDYNNTFQGNELSDGVYFYRFYPDGRDGVRDPVHGFFHLITEQ